MRLIRLNGLLLVTDELISVDGVEAGGLDPTDRVVSLPLLCDSNTQDRYLICRSAGKDIADGHTKVFEIEPDGRVRQIRGPGLPVKAGPFPSFRPAVDNFSDPYFAEQQNYLKALVRKAVPGAAHWAARGAWGLNISQIESKKTPQR